jgi:hypothetical protein
VSGRDGEGFDRIKPPDRRIMERAAGPRLDSEDADAEGRAALFTAGLQRDRDRAARERAGGAGRESARRRGHERGAGQAAAGGLAVHCSRCDVTSPLDAGAALRSALPLFLVAPWRDHPLFAVCPACGHRSWLKLAM